MRARSAAGLVTEIEAGVAGGALAPGQPLPSVRRLAAQLGLSPATVAAGLAELRRRGVVVTEPRRGSRIGERPPVAAGPSAMPVPPGARDLSLGNPDPALLPDLAGALGRCEQPTRLYGEAPELAPMAGLARSQLLADGVPGEEVCVLSGALDAIERVLEAWLRPGDRVAVENPGYAALFDLLRAQGLKMEPVAIDERGMIPEQLGAALAAGARAVVVTPRGQNPTGAAFDARRASQLRAVLGAHPDALLVEDDHLGPVAGSPLHTLTRGRRRWAATRSVAKSLGPDLRVAVLGGDSATIARVRGRQLCGPGWVSHVLQRLVLELWTDPDVQALIGRASTLYTERRERLIDALGRRGVAAAGASGLNVWVEVGEEAAVMSTLAQRGWVVAPGARYRLGRGSPAVRITTASLELDECERLADDLAEVLSPAPASRSG
ncbi:MAG: aminotransferase class I/II-fold pyridoxal phosphate-dependent enzyme [Solirubrobacteraceae bacterium]